MRKLTIAWLALLLIGQSDSLALGDDMPPLIDPDNLAVQTIAQETLMEPYEGKLAVAEVIRNRMAAKYMSDGTVAGTVLRAKQFSGWNTGDPVRIKSFHWDDSMPQIQDCIKAWNEAKAGSQTVQGAVLYYAPVLDGVDIPTPAWAAPEVADQVAQIGSHLFFKPKPQGNA